MTHPFVILVAAVEHLTQPFLTLLLRPRYGKAKLVGATAIFFLALTVTGTYELNGHAALCLRGTVMVVYLAVLVLIFM